MARRGYIFGTRKRPRIGRWIALLLLAAVAAVGVHAAVDNGRIVVKTQKVLVANLPKELEGFTVLHISDLSGKRFGPRQKQVENALKGKKYNAVCVTGDMVGKRGDAYPFYELLAALDTTKPVYFVAGDSDPSPLADHVSGVSPLADWIGGAQARGAVYLDSPVSLTVGKSRVWFSDAAQIPLDLETAETAYVQDGTPRSLYNAEAIAKTKAARAQMQDTDLHIALTHVPLGAETVLMMQNVVDANGQSFLRTVDVVLAGSTAGGQWVLPVVGPVWAEKWFPGKDMAVGYHRSGSLLQYVSGGLGVSGKSPLPDFRLFNSPEITLITFTSEMSEDARP